jgi:glutamine synthetase
MEYEVVEEPTDKKKVEFVEEVEKIKDEKIEQKEEPKRPIVIMAEYIWVSDYESGTICSKTKTLVFATNEISIKDIRQKTYNGLLTGEIDDDTKTSDIILQPIYICNDPIRGNPNILVLCETYYLDGQPTVNNKRNELAKVIETKEIYEKFEPWFSFKQEVSIIDDKQELDSDDKIYCKVGKSQGKFRSVMNQFYIWCLKVGMNISGFNSGTSLNKWEFNIGPGFGVRTLDNLVLSRYLMKRLTEITDIDIHFDKNAAGEPMTLKMYYSTKDMRKEDGDEVVEKTIEKLKRKHKDFIKIFGTKQDSKFTHGIGTNNTSVKYPVIAKNDKRNKYLVDNRIISNADPYIIAKNIFDTICN